MPFRAYHGLTGAVFAIVVVACFAADSPRGAEYRTIDASDNNLANPEWGMVGSQLLRWTDHAYADVVVAPRNGSLPSPRAVSNAVSAQPSPTVNARGASDWFWQWGQFLSHDIELTAAASPEEPFDIPVPAGDSYFDPGGSGTKTIPFNRSAYDLSTGTDAGNPREQINQITAYIDASNVYGSDATRASALRTFSEGRLQTSTAANGEVLLPLNMAGLPNDGGPAPTLFLAGDPRANEQVGLTAAHTLFVREHNRLADDIARRLDEGDPVITDKFNSAVESRDDFIYQTARKVVGAQMQIVTYEEFLPLLLGDAAPSAYGGYDATVNVGISNEFSTGAFRFGHTMLSTQLQRRDADGNDAGAVALHDAFFNPQIAKDDGVDSLLRGLSAQMAQEVDTLLIGDVRNMLFGPPGAGGMDLASLNIQRGRDHGLPGLNEVRSEMGMSPHADFLAMTGGDADLAAAFANVYGSIEDVDLWIGGLSETHVNGGMVGETFSKIIADQFTRIMEGDRFFYLKENELNHLLAFDSSLLETRLSDVIMRNSSINSMAYFAMQVPEPSTLVLLLPTAWVAARLRRRAFR